jgi:hypothetical protein
VPSAAAWSRMFPKYDVPGNPSLRVLIG